MWKILFVKYLVSFVTSFRFATYYTEKKVFTHELLVNSQMLKHILQCRVLLDVLFKSSFINSVIYLNIVLI